MGSKIVKLSEEVINQIAAGEVVENPASIVKELIENSLDAGALSLEISIEGGGTLLIRVEDNGCGMSAEDALLSLERHATSKIRTAEDLERLSTMGFRGEALAAISAVSRFELKTHDGYQGTLLRVEGGSTVKCGPCARNRGTTIEVRSLFFNTPARKKFLKSIRANTASVVRVVETLALAHPEVAFSLRSQGEEILQMRVEEQRARIEKMMGPMPIEISSTGSIRGFLALPEEAKSHRRDQYLFINRRFITSPLIARAIKMGYGTRLSENSHPSFVLFLDLAPNQIDVNVHPQKKEVRFSDERGIFQLFQRTVSLAFGDEQPVFPEPLFFPTPSFSLAEQTLAPVAQNLKATPLSFHFPIAERPLAVIDHFLLLQRDGFLLIDLQAAHARVLFETLQQKKPGIQRLLQPLEIPMEEEEILEELSELGIECRAIGKKMLAIDALPTWLEPSRFASFFAAWQKGKKIGDTTVHYCRGLKKKYTLDEAISLWEALQKCQECQLDPNCKPIWIKIEKQHLESLFG